MSTKYGFYDEYNYYMLKNTILSGDQQTSRLIASYFLQKDPDVLMERLIQTIEHLELNQEFL